MRPTASIPVWSPRREPARRVPQADVRTVRTVRAGDGPDGATHRLSVTNGTALLMSPPGAAPLTSPSIAAMIRTLGAGDADDIEIVRTAALAPAEALAFEQAGFDVVRRLALLVLDAPHRTRFGRPAPARCETTHERAADLRLRRVGRTRRSAGAHQHELLDVDTAAFPVDLRFAASDLIAAIAATPTTIVRAAFERGAAQRRMLGYALVGCAGRRGYLQRLAVHPAAQGRGIGHVLLDDVLAWCRRRGVDRVVVNTDHDNHVALHLYRTHGFVDAPFDLVVMQRRL